MDLAQQNKDKITAADRGGPAEAHGHRKLIGQIATQAYKSGGVPSNLTLFFGSNAGGSLADTMDLADQAMRSQNAALDKLSQQNATNVNSQARLAGRGNGNQGPQGQGGRRPGRGEGCPRRGRRQEGRGGQADRRHRVASTRSWPGSKPQIQAKLAAVKPAAGRGGGPDRRTAAAREGKPKQRRRRPAPRRRPRAGQASSQVPSARGRNPSAFGLRHPFAPGIPITSGFGWRQTPPGTIDFYGTGGYLHSGIDFGAPCGTPVYAAGAGER